MNVKASRSWSADKSKMLDPSMPRTPATAPPATTASNRTACVPTCADDGNPGPLRGRDALRPPEISIPAAATANPVNATVAAANAIPNSTPSRAIHNPAESATKPQHPANNAARCRSLRPHRRRIASIPTTAGAAAATRDPNALFLLGPPSACGPLAASSEFGAPGQRTFDRCRALPHRRGGLGGSRTCHASGARRDRRRLLPSRRHPAVRLFRGPRVTRLPRPWNGARLRPQKSIA